MNKSPLHQTEPITVRDQHCPQTACNDKDANQSAPVLIHSQKEKRFKCGHCGKTWVAHKKTIWFGIRTAIEKFWNAKELHDEGWTVRKMAEEIEVSPTTIQQWKGRWNLLSVPIPEGREQWSDSIRTASMIFQ